MAYAISWVIWLPLYGPSIGIHGLPQFRYQHAAGAYGPMLAALLVTLFSNGKATSRLVKSGLSVSNLPLLFIALFGPFILVLISMLAGQQWLHIPADLSRIGTSNELAGWSVFEVIMFNILTFGIGEEMGWRGVALPLLQSRYTALKASMILTVFWAGWHAPLFLYRPGYMHMDVGGAIGWLLSLLTGSILTTWFYNSSRGNVLICAVFHATIDVAFSSPGCDARISGIMGMLITLSGILVVIVFGYRNLSSLNRVQLRSRLVADMHSTIKHT